MKIISFLNEKGGCGKTTLSVNLAAGLAILGHRVVLVDADPQGHATVALGLPKAPALHDLLVREATFRDTLKPIAPEVFGDNARPAKGQLFLIPSNVETRVIPLLISDVWKLRKRLGQLKEVVDFIVIDTAPTPSLLHAMIYMATDAIIYPTTSERFGFDGLVESLNHTSEANEARLNSNVANITALGIIPNMYRAKTVEHSENVRVLVERYGSLVWDAIPQRITWAEASAQSRSVFALNPESAAARDAWRVVNNTVKAMAS